MDEQLTATLQKSQEKCGSVAVRLDERVDA
jgi:hypothetical protein